MSARPAPTHLGGQDRYTVPVTLIAVLPPASSGSRRAAATAAAKLLQPPGPAHPLPPLPAEPGPAPAPADPPPVPASACAALETPCLSRAQRATPGVDRPVLPQPASPVAASRPGPLRSL
eukprot:6214544-Pleurochrysis_carterae.AAC.2